MWLADAGGLEAVSLRNVAGELGVGPMRLYAYTATKEGLLDLMIDAVYAELLADTPFGSSEAPLAWRAVLSSFAEALRRASLRHRWFVGLLGGRPHAGPKALAFYEALLAALLTTVPSLELALDGARVTSAWAIGALHTENNDLARRADRSEHAEQRELWPWLRDQLDTGAFPVTRRIVENFEHPSDAETFARGLTCILDGVAIRLAPPRTAARRTKRDAG